MSTGSGESAKPTAERRRDRESGAIVRWDQPIAGEDVSSRRAAGMATAVEFARTRFETELKAAWTTILAG